MLLEEGGVSCSGASIVDAGSCADEKLSRGLFLPVSPGRAVTEGSVGAEEWPPSRACWGSCREVARASGSQGTSMECKRIKESPMDGRALV